MNWIINITHNPWIPWLWMDLDKDQPLNLSYNYLSCPQKKQPLNCMIQINLDKHHYNCKIFKKRKSRTFVVWNELDLKSKSQSLDAMIMNGFRKEHKSFAVSSVWMRALFICIDPLYYHKRAPGNQYGLNVIRKSTHFAICFLERKKIQYTLHSTNLRDHMDDMPLNSIILIGTGIELMQFTIIWIEERK